MKKLPIVVGFLAAIVFGGAFAQDQEQQAEPADADQIATMCEEKYSTESYSDENERNRLIDECIDTNLNSGKPQSDEG